VGNLRDRERRILFADFGDNGLVFEALFWLLTRTFLERWTSISSPRARSRCNSWTREHNLRMRSTRSFS
jgi:hypothetical protein